MSDPIKDIVENLQRALLKAGFNPGKIDGVMGNMTFDACKNYQRVGAIKEKKITKVPPIPTRAPAKQKEPGWRVAKSLLVLLAQVNERAPRRSIASDGTIGDKAHASRDSDHNPWIQIPGELPVVSGMDITHDPAGDCDCSILAEFIKSDPRVKYVIWNKKIYNKNVSVKWRKYTGTNPHTAHMHVSVKSDQEHFDNEKPWDLRAS